MKKIFLPVPKYFWVVFLLLSLCVSTHNSSAQNQSALKFEISFTSKAHPDVITGRVYVMVTRNKDREPRFQTRRSASAPFFGKDVEIEPEAIPCDES